MQTSVTFKNLDSSDTLKSYVEEKLDRFDRLLDNPAEANVVLSVEKFRHMAEINITGDRLSIIGKEETIDMYSAIDMVVDKVESQIKRYREKLKKRKSDGGSKPLVMKMNILAGESFEEAQKPQIIKTKQIYAKPMDVDEAVMQLDLANSEFLVFTNAKTRNINVIYRRKDGNFGLIEPES